MVSQLIGLSPVTIRAWETRYNVVQPTRSDGGHRLYSDEDVKDLRWLYMQTREKGLSISHAAHMLQKKKERLVTPSQDNEVDPEIEVEVASNHIINYSTLQNDLYDALIHVDMAKADQMIDLGFSMYPLEEMLHKVMVPLMIRVGDEWEQGIISVAQEHLMSEYVKQRFLQFFRIFPRNPQLPKVIAACPAGERHDVGLLLFSLFLRRKGIDVIYLGADTPVEGINDILERKHADWLCLSLTDPERLEDAVQYIQHVVDLRPQVKIIVGGKGFEALDNNHPYRPYLVDAQNEQWEYWYTHQFVHANNKH